MREARRLAKRHGDTTAADGVSFPVMAGAATGSLGPEGAGTSTTSRMIVGPDHPTPGDVTVNSRRHASHGARVAG